ncbi:MAG TPA: MFS transporter [Streptosporangiaceae bacterium]|nr:MFS transporter [Streptosporangiaceae bacterium]
MTRDTAESPARDRAARLAAYAGFAIQGLCFAVLVTRVPQIQRAHHLGDGALAIVLLLVPVIAGVGSVLSGIVFSRHGSAIVLRTAQPAVCASAVLIGMTGDNDAALYGAVALFGLFVGAVDASMNAQAVAVERRYRVSLINGYYAVWSAAGIVGGLWVSLANKIDLSLFAGFAVPAAAGLAGSLWTGRRLYRKPEEGSAPSGAELKAAGRLVPWRPILVIGAAMGVMYLADAATSTYSTKYLHDELDSSSAVAPLAYVAYQVAMVASRAIADFGVRRFGPARVVRAGAIVGLIGLAGVVAAPNAVVAIGAFAVAGLGLCVVPPVSFSAAGKVDPTGLGIAVSRVNVFNYVGFVAGAAVIGAIAPMSPDNGLRIAFVVPAALTLVIVFAARGFEPAAAAAPADPDGAARQVRQRL